MVSDIRPDIYSIIVNEGNENIVAKSFAFYCDFNQDELIDRGKPLIWLAQTHRRGLPQTRRNCNPIHLIRDFTRSTFRGNNRPL